MSVQCYDAPAADDYYDVAHVYATVMQPAYAGRQEPPPPRRDYLVYLGSINEPESEPEQLFAEPELSPPALRLLPSKQGEPIKPHCADEEDYIATGSKLAEDLGKFACDVSCRGTKPLGRDLFKIFHAFRMIKKRYNFDARNNDAWEDDDDQPTLF